MKNYILSFGVLAIVVVLTSFSKPEQADLNEVDNSNIVWRSSSSGKLRLDDHMASTVAPKTSSIVNTDYISMPTNTSNHLD